MIKFLHIGDIHAGKTLHSRSRNDDAEYAISQVIDFVKKEPVDFILMAGDIFDQYTPDAEATKIIFDFMVSELNALKIPVVMITGNHDGHSFFEGYKTLAKYANMHLFVKPSTKDYIITIKDTNIICVPYVFTKILDKTWEDNAASEYAHKVENFINALISKAPRNTFNILLSHMMVKSAKPTKSEREASIGEYYAINLDNINNLKNLDYVALGHVHKYQKIPTTTDTYYTGSCFQIDFNEEGQEKYFNFVILEQQSTNKVEKIKLDIKNQLKTLKVNAKSLNIKDIENVKGYVRVIIDDTIENTRLLESKLTSEHIAGKILEIRRNVFEKPDIEVDLNKIRNNLVDFYEEYYKAKYREDLPEDLKKAFVELQYKVEHTED
ncbi:nuclease SbcCD, D subunit [Hydrogenobaculum sp. Y04AAS1]|uniref:exonuclease subunit SbcD n=1 Tax=Hydrogenobaculum sp. (strain Y04AAS1) TaxID=380749 RepID=UPI00015BCD31|nr:nuclease SbcCD, D subunit [Hydrogenobaculum sp. Y04AAS1]HCT66340.1 exonuclease subunit SbcD [Hydrogenobaculum sp.]